MNTMYTKLEKLFCKAVPQAKSSLEVLTQNQIEYIDCEIKKNVEEKIGKEELDVLDNYITNNFENPRLADIVATMVQKILPNLNKVLGKDVVEDEVMVGTKLLTGMHNYFKRNNYCLDAALNHIAKDFSKKFLLYEILEEIFWQINQEFDPLNLNCIFQKENGSKVYSKTTKKAVNKAIRDIVEQELTKPELRKIEDCIRRNTTKPELKELISKVHRLTDRICVINPRFRSEDILTCEIKGGAILLLGLYKSLNKNSYDLEKCLGSLEGVGYDKEFSEIPAHVDELYKRVFLKGE